MVAIAAAVVVLMVRVEAVVPVVAVVPAVAVLPAVALVPVVEVVVVAVVVVAGRQPSAAVKELQDMAEVVDGEDGFASWGAAPLPPPPLPAPPAPRPPPPPPPPLAWLLLEGVVRHVGGCESVRPGPGRFFEVDRFLRAAGLRQGR